MLFNLSLAVNIPHSRWRSLKNLITPLLEIVKIVAPGKNLLLLGLPGSVNCLIVKDLKILSLTEVGFTSGQRMACYAFAAGR